MLYTILSKHGWFWPHEVKVLDEVGDDEVSSMLGAIVTRRIGQTCGEE